MGNAGVHPIRKKKRRRRSLIVFSDSLISPQPIDQSTLADIVPYPVDHVVDWRRANAKPQISEQGSAKAKHKKKKELEI
jgi:hypothetical protein